MQVRELALVERLIYPAADLPLQKWRGRENDVIRATTGQQSRFERIVGVEVGDVHLDTSLLFKIRQRVRARGSHSR